MQALARRMQPVVTTRGTHVSEQGDGADNVYFLQRGTVEVVHLGRPVGRLFAPVTFGEAALLRDEMDHADTRLSGYRATGTCLCATGSDSVLRYCVLVFV
jgi:CRP-like cAMP-binding protein